MSSNRSILPCDAVLQRHDQPAGPMRLPTKNSTAFIAEFNRRYDSAGLSVAAIKTEEPDDQDNPVSGPSPQ